MKDLYDFTDLSDLPEDLQSKLSNSGGAENPAVQKLVDIITNAPRPLSLTEVIAVGTRSELDLPSAQTVAKWVKKAAEEGRIFKPTRQTYWKAVPEAAELLNEPEPVEVVDAPVDLGDDPLADLG